MFTISLRRALLALTLVAASVSSALAQRSLPLIQSPTGTLLRPTPEELIANQGDLECPLELGGDIAIRGNRAIAAMTGAGCAQGRIAVFERNSFGVWQRSGTIVPQTVCCDPEWRLALGESRAFIMSATGQVEVFLRSGNEWLFEATVAHPMSNPAPGRLAFDQGWVVAGGPQSDTRPTEDGSLSIFQRRNGTWTLVQSLESGDEDNDFSRAPFAIEGATLVIGAPGFDQGRGAVYIYKLNSGVWIRRQRITNPGAPGDGFGASVAIGSGLIAVGAPLAQQLDPPTCGSFGASGAAYFYIPSGSSWVLRHVLSHRFADCHYLFGSEVAITATHLAVQSRGNLPDTPGKIVLYRRTAAGTWSAIGRDRGYSHAVLALSPTTMMVGVPFDGGLEPFGVPFEARDVGGQINAFDLATVTAEPLRR
jgi:FG-GAP repeat protein